MKKSWLVLFLVMFGVACGEDEISEGNLSGQINGESWSFAGGYAEDVFDDGELWISLYATESEDPCGFNTFNGDHVLIVRPAALTDDSLSLGNNITIVHGGSNNAIVTSGRLVIDTVTESTIGGGLLASMDNHSLDGVWEVPICPRN